MEVGDNLKVELIRVNNDGKGVFLTEDDKLVLIDDVSDDDKLINIEITAVFEESAFAKKIGNAYNKTKKEEGDKEEEKESESGPYGLDDEEDDYDENDYEED